MSNESTIVIDGAQTDAVIISLEQTGVIVVNGTDGNVLVMTS